MLFVTSVVYNSSCLQLQLIRASAGLLLTLSLDSYPTLSLVDSVMDKAIRVSDMLLAITKPKTKPKKRKKNHKTSSTCQNHYCH